VNGTQVAVLQKFLTDFDGGARVNKEATIRRQTLQSINDKIFSAQVQMQQRQLGDDPIPVSGKFRLEEGGFDDMLPRFFDDQLMRGRWLCFRIADPALVEVLYCSLPVSEGDDGAPDSGDTFRDVFRDWKVDFEDYTSDNTPLRLANMESVPSDVFTTKIDEFNRLQEEKFQRAVGKLHEVKQAQTLCVYRFQGQLATREEASQSIFGPNVYDICTTWESVQPDVKITIVHKVKVLMNWLLGQKVLKSDFFRDARPNDFGIDYRQALKKARGGL